MLERELARIAGDNWQVRRLSLYAQLFSIYLLYWLKKNFL